MSETFILIPGRTSRQGSGISEGKFAHNYVEETSLLQITPEDAERLGIAAGDRVRMISEDGEAEVTAVLAKQGDMPPGMLFIAYGDASSRLMGGDTHGSGMPTSKGFDVKLEKVL
jgi:formylmethanofuran dehydrogenase subunit D